MDEKLINASKNGNLETVMQLLENGADVHTWHDFALCTASFRGHLEIVKLLLEKGADIHADGDSALRRSVENGHLEIAKLLLEKGANIHVYHNYELQVLLTIIFKHFLKILPFYLTFELPIFPSAIVLRPSLL